MGESRVANLVIVGVPKAATSSLFAYLAQHPDICGSDEKELGRHPFGSGPQVTRGSTLHPLVTERLIEAGDAAGIPYTLVSSARATWTDADAFHISRAGIPTGLVSVPLRYMHSPVELVQLDDVANAARLIAEFVRRLPTELDFRR